MISSFYPTGSGCVVQYFAVGGAEVTQKTSEASATETSVGSRVHIIRQALSGSWRLICKKKVFFQFLSKYLFFPHTYRYFFKKNRQAVILWFSEIGSGILFRNRFTMAICWLLVCESENSFLQRNSTIEFVYSVKSIFQFGAFYFSIDCENPIKMLINWLG